MSSDTTATDRVTAVCATLGIPLMDPRQIVADADGRAAAWARVQTGEGTAEDERRVLRSHVSVGEHANLARVLLHLLGETP